MIFVVKTGDRVAAIEKHLIYKQLFPLLVDTCFVS